MQVCNGYIDLRQNHDDVVMTATELDPEIPSGSRTARVLLNLDQIRELLTLADSFYRSLPSR